MVRNIRYQGFSVKNALGASMILAVALMVSAPAAQAQTFHVLHTFSGGGDGAWPYAGLTPDNAGNFYGTAGVLNLPYHIVGAGSSELRGG